MEMYKRLLELQWENVSPDPWHVEKEFASTFFLWATAKAKAEPFPGDVVLRFSCEGECAVGSVAKEEGLARVCLH